MYRFISETVITFSIYIWNTLIATRKISNLVIMRFFNSLLFKTLTTRMFEGAQIARYFY